MEKDKFDKALEVEKNNPGTIVDMYMAYRISKVYMSLLDDTELAKYHRARYDYLKQFFEAQDVASEVFTSSEK